MGFVRVDFAIDLNEGIAENKLFEKRDTFKFSVVRMPYKRGNIPQKIFYATIGAEVLRICRATSNCIFLGFFPQINSDVQ